jgi:hypothetical protein
MPSPLSERLAGNADLGTHVPFNLFAGEAKIITESFDVGADLDEFQVFGLNAAGLAVPHNPVVADPEDPVLPESVAVGITCFAVLAASQPKVSGYTGGFFNHEALVWHASLTTLIQRRSAFLPGSSIKIGRIL